MFRFGVRKKYKIQKGKNKTMKTLEYEFLPTKNTGILSIDKTISKL